MLKSYVGLASLDGLEVLLPETEQAIEALAAFARPRRAVCCWAVLSGEDAVEIDQRLAAGERASALALLEATARGAGCILPTDLAG